MSKSESVSKRAQTRGQGKSKAVALRYNLDEDMAPVVIASGYGTIADKIIGIAEEKGIPVYKDDSAASMLCMLEVGRTIPSDLYEVIAAIYMQILIAANNVKQQTGQETGPAPVAEQLRQRLKNAGEAGLEEG
ncbi:EscU/YscU/HrcU family type III secretion system export apparatus switch protein [Ruminococcaceae bacterium OttesenSCG-928-I18]|nr:EscU/YscU/HrcU family type III secretion system export apparatus switch protein [Ruminococcaceae bacterium OttesenSCG-928-I18]